MDEYKILLLLTGISILGKVLSNYVYPKETLNTICDIHSWCYSEQGNMLCSKCGFVPNA